MKDTWKKAVLVFVPILILGLVVSVSAQDIFRALGNERLIKELNLSPEQKESLKKIRLESREKRIDVDARMQKARLQFEQEMEKDDMNREKIMELVEVMGNAQTEMRKIAVTELIEAKTVLNPEQREKARNLIARWKANQERQKDQARINKPGRAGRPGNQGTLRQRQAPNQKPDRQRIAPQRRDRDQDRPGWRGDRSELMGFPQDSLFGNEPEKNVAELQIPDPDFGE
jgi:Spy/CpxP family protein refolding chaperone